MKDCIELRGLRVVGTHGALPEEQERAQPFEVDVVIDAPLVAPGASDDLADTIDYGLVVATVAEEVAGAHANLIEHLAERVAAAVLRCAQPGVARKRPAATSVTVTVRKLRPPVPYDLASAAVTITRHAEWPE